MVKTCKTCVSLLKFCSAAPLSCLCRGLEAWGEQWEWAGGAGGGEGGGRGCILNPTNPAVLNLCLPVPEEEAAGRTHSAPPGPNPVSPPCTDTQQVPSLFVSSLYFTSGEPVAIGSSRRRSVYLDLILIAEDLKISAADAMSAAESPDRDSNKLESVIQVRDPGPSTAAYWMCSNSVQCDRWSCCLTSLHERVGLLLLSHK